MAQKKSMPVSLARRERDPAFLQSMAILARISLQSRKLPEAARQRAQEAIDRYDAIYKWTSAQESRSR